MNTMTPSLPTPPGRADFRHLLHAEWTKFRTVRGWVTALSVSAAVFVLLSFLSAFASRGPFNGSVAVGPGGEAVIDSYMLVHQTLAGDGTLTVRVTSLSGAYAAVPQATSGAFSQRATGALGGQLSPGLAPWAKAGIILEPDTKQGTAYAAVLVTGSHGVQMQDNYSHDSAGLAGSAGPSAPRWLRLRRAGDVITGYDSANGAHWFPIGTARLGGIPRNVQIGLFVTSPMYFAAGQEIGSPSVATAGFDHVTASGDLPLRSWRPAAVGASSFAALPSAFAWQQKSASAFTISGSGDIAPLVGDILSAAWAGASIVNGTIAALAVVIVLGTVFATSEYRRGLIRATFAATQRRGRVLAAKALVAGSVTFVAGAVAATLAEVITRHVLAANGNYLFAQSGLDLVRVIAGTGLLLGLAAALAVALGMMLRRGSAAVAAGILLLVVPGVLGSEAGNWLMRFTPTAAFAVQATLPRSSLVTSVYTPPNGYFPISSWGGLAVLAGYTGIALCAAAWLIRRRDA